MQGLGLLIYSIPSLHAFLSELAATSLLTVAYISCIHVLVQKSNIMDLKVIC